MTFTSISFKHFHVKSKTIFTLNVCKMQKKAPGCFSPGANERAFSDAIVSAASFKR